MSFTMTPPPSGNDPENFTGNIAESIAHEENAVDPPRSAGDGEPVEAQQYHLPSSINARGAPKSSTTRYERASTIVAGINDAPPRITPTLSGTFSDESLGDQSSGLSHDLKPTFVQDVPIVREHKRNMSTITTVSRMNKRFSVQPQPPSPTRSVAESILPKYDAGADAVGEEPGINVDTMEVDIPDSVGSQVTIVDYSDANCQISHYDVPKGLGSEITGSSDRKMLGRRLDEAVAQRPSWGRVRWIVVNGLSWEAIRPIAVHYNLHPLALEDMLDVPQRTKMEVFREQIFCCFPLHMLHVTPTPFSLLHSIARRCVLKIYQALCAMHALFAKLGAAFTAMYMTMAGWLVSLRSSAGTDAEQQQDPAAIVCNVHGRAHVRMSTPCSSNAPSVCSSPSSTVKKTYDRSNNFSSESRMYASSKWSSSSVTLTEEPECVPFYTCDHGTLCSNTQPTPIEDMLRAQPARSMYEWNRDNLALHHEALQNMRIQGSANSVEIALEQVSLFLLPDTVITIFEKSAQAVYEPIENRLLSPLTMLRQTSDASVLVQAIFDVSVDLVRPILHEYRSQLSRLQVEGVHQPNLRHTRALHAFMTELTMMRTLVRSLTSLVDALRSKTVMAAADLTRKNSNASQRQDAGEIRNSSHHQDVVARSISAKAAEYLSDVADHAKSYLEDLDGMHTQSQTLSSLIFDTISIRAGDSVKMLSLVSVIFLPLTFLTGYFGMNFKSFTTLNHDVGYYWLVSTPAAAALTAILMYPTIMSQLQEWWSWAKLQV